MSENNGGTTAELSREERLRRANALAELLMSESNKESKTDNDIAQLRKSIKHEHDINSIGQGTRVFHATPTEKSVNEPVRGHYAEQLEERYPVAPKEEPHGRLYSEADLQITEPELDEKAAEKARKAALKEEKKEKKRERKRKLGFIRFLIRLISLLVVAAALALMVSRFTSFDAVGKAKELYHAAKDKASEIIDGFTIDESDFKEPILGEAKKQKTLVVYTRDVTVESELSQSFLDLDIFKKSQYVRSFGTGHFAIDLASFDEGGITVDTEAKTVTVKLPPAYLYLSEYDVTKTEYSDTENGFLSFGDISLSPEQQNEFERGVANSIKSALDTKENLTAADAAAKEAAVNIFSPIVQSVSEEYKLIIE